jgi:signal transduction histidine kinase
MVDWADSSWWRKLRQSADPDRIREVISNLIDNAIKYSKENTTIDVSLKGDKKQITFSVTDMGIGITTEDQKHLFQKFYRVNNSFTRDVGGTGLGLYIARNLIEQFGGKIWVTSQEGKGSTFSFTLPVDNDAAAV